MPKASVLVALVAVPCFAQVPSTASVNLAAVLGFSESAPQNGLPFQAGGGAGSWLSTTQCTDGATRTLPTGNCCQNNFNLEKAKEVCVGGVWQVDSYFCGQASCR